MTDKEKNHKENIENPLVRLTDKIINSDFFLAIGTEAYLRKLADPYSDVSIQIKIAEKYNKPTIILIDSKLPGVKKIELDRYFHDMNVIGVIETDWRDDSSINDAVHEIRDILVKHGIKDDE